MKDSKLILELITQNLDLIHHQIANLQELIEFYNDSLEKDE